MKRYHVNLKSFFNQRLVYPYETEFDIMKPYYVEEKFTFGKVKKNGIIVLTERNEDKNDNVICDGQIIEIPNVTCNRVIIAGTCCWGYYKEKFMLEFDDGTSDCAQVSFHDWYWSAEPAITGSMELDAAEWKEYANILIEYDKRNNEKDERHKKCFIYYTATELAMKGRQLKRIIFPDNMFMNIFAITLED